MTPQDQSIAISALRNDAVFDRTSRRLLADLLGRGTLLTIERKGKIRVPGRKRNDQQLNEDWDPGRLIVLEGTLLAYPPPRHETATRYAVKYAGQVFTIEDMDRKYSFKPSSRDGYCRALYLKNADLADVLKVCPFLARSLEDKAIKKILGKGKKWWPYPLTLISADGGNFPLEAMTFLLAAAVADVRTPKGPSKATAVAVIRCKDNQAWIIEGTSVRPVPEKAVKSWLRRTRTALATARQKKSGAPARPSSRIKAMLDKVDLVHAFFVPDDTSLEHDDALPVESFHQVVYLTTDTVQDLPEELRKRLYHYEALEEDERGKYNAFVPTIIADTSARNAPPRKRRAFTVVRASDDYDPRAKHHRGEAEDNGPPMWTAAQRDSCMLRLDLAAVAERWDLSETPAASSRRRNKGRGKGRGKSFPLPRVSSDDPTWQSAQRWGRAVANCQIGVVLSGGGASAFRAHAILDEMHKQGLPVDVIGGVSGGAVVGAYYATMGMPGFDVCFTNAEQFRLAGTLSMITSRFMQAQVDRDLRGARVEDLEVRFAAVAGALPEDGAPCGVVVTHGTVGEAVRASGSLALGYGPTLKGGYRYTDGAVAAPIPVDIVRNLGADVVLAFNCIPGPDRGNPFSASPIGKLVYRYTIAGRLIDAWVSQAFLLQQSGRMAMATADVRLEPRATQRPLLEVMDWTGIRKIARQSRMQDGQQIKERVNQLALLWDEVRTGISVEKARK